jgi:integrase
MANAKKSGVRYLFLERYKEQLKDGLEKDPTNPMKKHQKVFDRMTDAKENKQHIDPATGKYEKGYVPADTTRAKLYSPNSKSSYYGQTGDFYRWLKSTGRPTRFAELKEAEKYLVPYMEDLCDRVLAGDVARKSAKDYRAALVKGFDLPAEKTKKGAGYLPELPQVNNAAWVRSRKEVGMDRHFSREKHADVVAFQECTGLRRHDLEHLKGGQFFVDGKGRPCLQIYNGKGGKDRIVHIYHADQAKVDAVIRKMKSTENGSLVWGKQSSAWDIHGDRAAAARMRYEAWKRPLDQIPQRERFYKIIKDKITGKPLRREIYDLRAMLMISNDWGHNRADVTAYNYLDGVAGYPDDGGHNPSQYKKFPVW